MPGIGSVRKRALLNRFGSVRGVRGASEEELISVAGINSEIARTIYAFFHPQ
ncbi:helix-hairpin-helix domain-containing protein [Asaia platycodi]|uniref:helix-hairpin-helix domain-containing protein n=1 Tax=Asaia platycodi TaxID=610243 RepID=UPI0034E2BE41